MIPFSEKLVILRYVATRFASKSYLRYEVDELMNEAWLNENVRSCEDRSRLFMAARWAMIRYMQTEQKANHRRPPHFQALNPRVHDSPQYDSISEDLNYLDEMELFCRSLTPEQKVVVDMRLAGCHWKQIARRIRNVSKERIRQIFDRAVALMRIKYEICYRERKAQVA